MKPLFTAFFPKRSGAFTQRNLKRVFYDDGSVRYDDLEEANTNANIDLIRWFVQDGEVWYKYGSSVQRYPDEIQAGYQAYLLSLITSAP